MHTSSTNPASRSQQNLWSAPNYYQNFIQNMYPTAAASHSSSHAPVEPAYTEDDRVNQQMALLLRRNDSRLSPGSHDESFNIDLPGQREEEERRERSQELGGTETGVVGAVRGHTRSASNSLGEQQAWERVRERDGNRGRERMRPSTAAGTGSGHGRSLSREERRREIELGHV